MTRNILVLDLFNKQFIVLLWFLFYFEYQFFLLEVFFFFFSYVAA